MPLGHLDGIIIPKKLSPPIRKRTPRQILDCVMRESSSAMLMPLKHLHRDTMPKN